MVGNCPLPSESAPRVVPRSGNVVLARLDLVPSPYVATARLVVPPLLRGVSLNPYFLAVEVPLLLQVLLFLLQVALALSNTFLVVLLLIRILVHRSLARIESISFHNSAAHTW